MTTDLWTQGEDAFPPENQSLTGDRRTEARLAAVQALFAVGLLEGKGDPTTLQKDFAPRLKQRKADTKLFTLIFEAATADRPRYAAMLQAHAREDWPLERMDPVLLALFWAMAAELSANPAAGSKIVLNEFLNIAKGFVSQPEVSWLNAVGAQLATKLRADLA